ncbi:hypothetical protein B0G76_2619 [Paraburkholderia sp. BL23I1N1]|uniref:hypothetical protein n=1 Tax=Paraburkholderia sp. BL23I1N1 TaxID=1938802 RepID=UPI000FF845A8|nr:hypothetical protein [Paraburkholderia sp. BL23I1N1]RKE36434.1 hypothetical protein B0G76_2619 [Paraburkholderia sp. BL23I1N1]
MTRRVTSPWSCTAFSVTFMVLGFYVDILRNPTGSVIAVCSSSNSLVDSFRLHIAMMPAAHLGMLLAPFFLVATDFGRTARNPIGTMVRTGGFLLEMLSAEIVVLYFIDGAQSPIFMMLAMAGIMSVFACIRSILKNCGRSNRAVGGERTIGYEVYSCGD